MDPPESGQLKTLLEAGREFVKGDFDAIPLDQLVDHSPTSYAKNIWENICGHL